MVGALENISLKPYNTFGIDHTTRYLIEVNSRETLLQIFRDPKWAAVPKMVLGGGSNVLFCKDFDGLILKINTKGIDAQIEGTRVLVKVEAGEIWHDFVMHCVDKGWAGIENLSLIPGCVGAAPIQNIGAYGVEVKDVIKEVEVLDLNTLSIQRLANKDCEFGYRESIFKDKSKGRYIVLGVVFELLTDGVLNTQYGAIKDILSGNGIQEPSIRDVSNAVIQIRTDKLPDPKVIGNAGSFFKNPEISNEHYQILKTSNPDIPSFPTNEGQVKIPAGWLIEKCGWKGKTINNYGVHKNQALVLVNYGGANGNDIKQLSGKIQQDVFEKFGIQLTNEVNFID